jgi:hypothetical protein
MIPRYLPHEISLRGHDRDDRLYDSSLATIILKK